VLGTERIDDGRQRIDVFCGVVERFGNRNMDDQKRQAITYSERKAARFVFSFSFENVERQSECECHNCSFYDIPQTDECVFSVTERDDKKGFGIEMHGVTVVPSTYLCVSGAPKWLAWIAAKVCDKVVQPNKELFSERAEGESAGTQDRAWN